ncbi:hypothetical protein EB796_005108 [Bugula neritina]|uniref:Uncharacterized protein n=1 Tax=Bugula neritina TaxID=10212 RepID=A0A7J7KF69_BUGNE|nr:hypothetical protein EB796_005108 [Bugula neritina]
MDLSKKDSVTNTAPASIVDLKADCKYGGRSKNKVQQKIQESSMDYQQPWRRASEGSRFQNRSPDEEEKLEASRMALEAKSKMYEKMAAISHGGSNSEETTEQLPDLMSSDMHREILRQKWEAEQKYMLDNQDTVHYANVRFDGMNSVLTLLHESSSQIDYI